MNARVLVSVALSMLVLAGCQRDENGSKRAPAAAGAQTIVGAGATFPYPLYAKWGHAYHQQTGVRLNYQSIGSGGGIKQIQARTVDFGASDAPMSAKELEVSGLVQFPMVMGAVVAAVNLKGVDANELVLDGPTLARIYLGEITRWNDPAIASLNPGLALPDKSITPVYRADGSGTTWIFTHYLSAVSPAWKERVGVEKAVSWPAGVGGKGNEGVAAYVQRVDGALGYVEYAYALQNGLAVARMRNAAGVVVKPELESFQAAASTADWKNAQSFYVVLTNQPGERSWPIVGASFILMHARQQDAAKARALLRFFDFAYRHGDAAATELHYVPMPQDVAALVRTMWATGIVSDGRPVWDETPAEKR